MKDHASPLSNQYLMRSESQPRQVQLSEGVSRPARESKVNVPGKIPFQVFVPQLRDSASLSYERYQTETPSSISFRSCSSDANMYGLHAVASKVTSSTRCLQIVLSGNHWQIQLPRGFSDLMAIPGGLLTSLVPVLRSSQTGSQSRSMRI